MRWLDDKRRQTNYRMTKPSNHLTWVVTAEFETMFRAFVPMGMEAFLFPFFQTMGRLPCSNSNSFQRLWVKSTPSSAGKGKR